MKGIHLQLLKAILYPADEKIDAVTALKYQRFQVMRNMGWTYREYQSNPAWLNAEVAMFLKTESKIMEQMNG